VERDPSTRPPELAAAGGGERREREFTLLADDRLASIALGVVREEQLDV
jgi:hypothetical protein